MYRFIASALLMGWTGMSQAAVHEVAIQGFAFSPTTLRVEAGDTVRWTNKDAFNHTATADDGRWDTGIIAGGASAEITFRSPGGQPYFCDVHPSMKGQVVVGNGSGETHEVTVRNNVYDPETVVINSGDTVRWTNFDLEPHTATATDETWDTGMFFQGESVAIVFNFADGELPYFCTVHPEMLGTVDVQATGPCDLTVELSGQPESINRGERLSFTARAVNDCDENHFLDNAVMKVTGPASVTQPLYAGRAVPIRAGSSASAPVGLQVPSIAPTGTYTVTVTISLAGEDIASDSFRIDVN